MFLMLYSSSLKLKLWVYYLLFLFFNTGQELLNFSTEVPNAARKAQYVLHQIQQAFPPQVI